MNINSPTYQKAFVKYLRRGTPIDLETKSDEYPTTHYIWRTRGDGKVRQSHTKNNGKIFAWNDPPNTGHPGEDYGCRCIAKPYYPRLDTYTTQEVISTVDDSSDKWDTIDFLIHSYTGDGRGVSLEEIGNLQDIINVAKHKIFPNVNKQVIDEARKTGEGFFKYDFYNHYYFGDEAAYAHGSSKVSGIFSGNVTKLNGYLFISGTIEYKFEDVFTDPVNIRQVLIGTSDISKAKKLIKIIIDILRASGNLEYISMLAEELGFEINEYTITADNILKLMGADSMVADFIFSATDGLGTYYPVKGNWTTEFNALIKNI